MRARQQVLVFHPDFFIFGRQRPSNEDYPRYGHRRRHPPPRALARYTPLIASGAILLARAPTPRTETLRMGADLTPSDATTIVLRADEKQTAQSTTRRGSLAPSPPPTTLRRLFLRGTTAPRPQTPKNVSVSPAAAMIATADGLARFAFATARSSAKEKKFAAFTADAPNPTSQSYSTAYVTVRRGTGGDERREHHPEDGVPTFDATATMNAPSGE